MARFTLGLMAGIVIATVAGAAVGIHAQSDVAEAAAAAGVPEPELAAAIDSQPGVNVWQYLRWEGKLPPLAPPEPAYGVWDRLAMCESSGNWASRSNPIYKGGLQFDAATWARHGGLDYAWRADFATRSEQIRVAQRTLAAQGWGAWPRCSRLLGLR